MTKALAIAENQVRAIIRAAQKEGARVEVKIGEMTVVAFPGNHDPRKASVDHVANPEDFQSIDEYMAWRDRSRAGAD